MVGGLLLRYHQRSCQFFVRDGTALLEGCWMAAAFVVFPYRRLERRCKILMIEAPLASLIFDN